MKLAEGHRVEKISLSLSKVGLTVVLLQVPRRGQICSYTMRGLFRLLNRGNLKYCFQVDFFCDIFNNLNILIPLLVDADES